jgi:AAA15 family ATPase/GTPase
MPTTTAEETKKSEASKDKKSELLLDSLEIKGYRCFEHLTIEKLDRVNLIVGKNNVGKTALLEALWIYALKGTSQILLEVLESRRELSEGNSVGSSNHKAFDLRPLFYKGNGSEKSSFEIGVAYDDRSQTLKIEMSWLVSEIKQLKEIDNSQVLKEEEIDNSQVLVLREYGGKPDKLLATPYVKRSYATSNNLEPLFSNEQNSNRLRSTTGFSFNSAASVLTDTLNVFIFANGLNSFDMARLWDRASILGDEQVVLTALNLIFDPQGKRIRKLNFANIYSENSERIPIINIADSNEPVSLYSLGKGMINILGIALGLVNCKAKLLLIDEIETGLHYSVLLDVWRMIFKTAREWNVQVFATTHSSDCIKAFQRAAEEDKEDEGMLIRLVRKGDKIKAVLFDEEELETVVENNIEVR